MFSLVSGFAVGRLSGLVAPATKITQAVPLPAAAKRRSPTAIYPRDPLVVELFASLGAAFEADTENAFDALCVATATMATYFAFAEGASSWLTRHGIPPSQARDDIARIQSGLAETAMDAPERSFQALAADHATRGGTNEQVLGHLVEHGLLDALLGSPRSGDAQGNGGVTQLSRRVLI